MAFPARILNSILLALAMSIAGCTPVPRPDSSGHHSLSFSIVAPDARTVAVAGSFNRWDPNSHPLSGPDRLGRWSASLHLPPGRYEYLFVVNGADWTPDPLAPSADDGFGERNSIVIVTGDPNEDK